MTYLEQAREAYKRRIAARVAETAGGTAQAAECETSELSERTTLTATPVPPMHDAEEHAGRMNTVTGPPCWACRKAVYWLRRKEDGGGPVCATCHPPPAAERSAAS
jgi:hypothetical protein